MSFQEFTQRVLEKFNISPYVMKMHYTLKFSLKVIQDLKDEDELDNVVTHGDDFAIVYIVESPHVEAIKENRESCVCKLLLGRYMVLETHVNEI